MSVVADSSWMFRFLLAGQLRGIWLMWLMFGNLSVEFTRLGMTELKLESKVECS